MKKEPAIYYPFILIIGFSWLPLNHCLSQVFYDITGPQVIEEYCFNQYAYTIESNVQIEWTEWYIEPSNGTVLGGSTYSIEIIFWAPGTYILIANSVTANGQQLWDSITIEVLEQQSPFHLTGCYEYDETKDCYNVCAHSTTTFYGQFFQGEYWFDGIQSYTADEFSGTITVTWGNGGPGNVKILADCFYEWCFEVLPEPVASFNTIPAAINDTLTVCQNQQVYFNNQSQNGLSYSWDYGDGTQDQNFNASHSFNTEGSYTVTLFTESICACTAEKKIIVKVLPSPVPELDCVNSVCPGMKQRYTATSDGCSQFNWSVSSNGTVVNGGGIDDDFIEIIWHNGPEGIIELNVENCATQYCSFGNIFRIPIITPDGPIAGDNNVCSGDLTTYEVPFFPGTVYEWEVDGFGEIIGENNTNSVLVKWDEGNIISTSTIKVQYENCFHECGGKDELEVRVRTSFYLDGDTHVCQDAEATFEAKGNLIYPEDMSWHLENESGDTVFFLPGITSNVSHTFSYPEGNYRWVATNIADDYCNDDATWNIQVIGKPSPPLTIIGENEICPGIESGFTIVPSGDHTIEWEVIDGTNTYYPFSQSFQHAFGNEPPYMVSAVHRDIQFYQCKSDPVSITLQRIDELTIEGPGEVCMNDIQRYTFEFTSGIDYMWELIPSDHGQIKKSNLNDVDIFWTKPGPARLRLRACGFVFDKEVDVRPLPVFNLTGPLSACANEEVIISTDQPSLIHTWLDESLNPIGFENNIQLNPGVFAVRIKDIYRCENEQTFAITSYPAPVVNISSTSDTTFCTTIPGGVDIVANTDGDGYSFEWFQNNVSTGSMGPVFNVTDFSSYHVAVTNGYGCQTISPDVTFTDCCPPEECSGAAVCLAGGGCTCLPYDFNFIKTEIECHIHRYELQIPEIISSETNWFIRSVSEGIIGSIKTDKLEYTYTKPGYYFITAISRLTGYPYDITLCGHWEHYVDTIRAVANFEYQGTCAGENFLFNDLTTFLPQEEIVSWEWNFGDPESGVNNTSAFQNPAHVFWKGGDYEVLLKVILKSGCYTTVRKNVRVSAGPDLQPEYDNIHCQGEAVGLYLPGEYFEIDWDFGDPVSGSLNTASADSAYHIYSNSNIYSITVSASDVYKCRGEITFSIDVRPNTLDGTITIDPASICYGDTATLSSPPGGIYWEWNTRETTEVIRAAETNHYSLVVTNEFNCRYVPVPVFLEVWRQPFVTVKGREVIAPGEYGAWLEELHVCEGTEVEIQGFYIGASDFSWSTGDWNEKISFTSEGGDILSPGIHHFTFYVEQDFTGCSNEASYTIDVFPLPEKPVISLIGGSGCSDDDNVLQVMNPVAETIYVWSDGQTGTSIHTSASEDYFVTAINQEGCSIQSELLHIKTSALADQIQGGCYLKCDPLSVCLPALEDVSFYTIFQNGFAINSGTSWPEEFLITDDGSYTIEIISSNGCKATSDPLDITLYQGVGNITVLTYFDTDGNGLIGPPDVLLPNIPVEIISSDGIHSGETFTNENGEFVFEDYPSLFYTAAFNQELLSSEWKIIIDSVQGEIRTCNDSIVVALLLQQNCSVYGPALKFEICPGESVILGDSTWSDVGTYVVHEFNSLGCDSIFEVEIRNPDSITINSLVWVDVDRNGVLSPDDTLLNNTTIYLLNELTSEQFSFTSGTATTLPDGEYSIQMDTLSLTGGLITLYWNDVVEDTLCGETSFNFLVSPTCAPVFIIQQEFICEGDSILIQDTLVQEEGLYSFSLSPSGAFCDTTLDVYVRFHPSLQVETSTSWNCLALGTIEVQPYGVGPYDFAWSNNNDTDSLVTQLEDGLYSVTVTDVNGCTVNTDIDIASLPPLDFSIYPYYEITFGDTLSLHIEGDTLSTNMYQWQPAVDLSCSSCASLFAFPAENVTLTIEITDSLQCHYSLQTNIVVNPVEPLDTIIADAVYIPNVFSPNGDNANDIFSIYSRLPDVHLQELTIMDRWGELVFYTDNIPLDSFKGWDGNFNDKPMNPQVFVYIAQLKLSDGKFLKLKGDVTIVK